MAKSGGGGGGGGGTPGVATFGFELPNEKEKDTAELIRERITANIGALQGSEYARDMLR